jgi:hypothetical protein
MKNRRTCHWETSVQAREVGRWQRRRMRVQKRVSYSWSCFFLFGSQIADKGSVRARSELPSLRLRPRLAALIQHGSVATP